MGHDDQPGGRADRRPVGAAEVVVGGSGSGVPRVRLRGSGVPRMQGRGSRGYWGGSPWGKAEGQQGQRGMGPQAQHRGHSGSGAGSLQCRGVRVSRGRGGGSGGQWVWGPHGEAEGQWRVRGGGPLSQTEGQQGGQWTRCPGRGRVITGTVEGGSAVGVPGVRPRGSEAELPQARPAGRRDPSPVPRSLVVYSAQPPLSLLSLNLTPRDPCPTLSLGRSP